MQPEIVTGTSPNGADRQLDCWVDGEGRVALWVHSPDSDRNGWEIHVSATELAAVLARLGVPVRQTPA
jgi:hypothetical protein